MKNPDRENQHEGEKPAEANIDTKRKEQKTKEKETDREFQAALNLLLSKELADFPLERKRDFLYSKFPKDLVDKAISVLPEVSSYIKNYTSQVERTLGQSHRQTSNEPNRVFKSLTDIGLLSTVVITTLGVNYLLDLNRNKKNETFYNEVQGRLDEQAERNSKSLREMLNNELENFCKKDDLEFYLRKSVKEYNESKGISLNAIGNGTKAKVGTLDREVQGLSQKVKELEVKIDNSRLILQQSLEAECGKILEKSSKELIKQLREDQSNFLIQLSEKLLVGGVRNAKESNSCTQGDLQRIDNSLKTHEPKQIEDNIKEPAEDKAKEEAPSGFEPKLRALAEAIENKDLLKSFLSTLKVGFSNILVSAEDENDKKFSSINLNNANFKRLQRNKEVSELIEAAGFKRESESKLTLADKDQLERSVHVLSNVVEDMLNKE